MDIREQIEKAGVPVNLRADALNNKVAEEFGSKLDKATAAMFADFPVAFLVGNDSPQKDGFAAALLKAYMVQKNKTGRWMPTPRTAFLHDDFNLAGVTVILSLDLYAPTAAKMLSALLRESINKGRAFIICCSGIEIAEELLGKEFMAFISHLSVFVDVGIPRAKILEVK
jgi:hypothetical protein